jgi:hypothetical protein
MNQRIASVFLSHSAREPDHTIAKSLADGLQKVGFDVWWDIDGLEGGDFFPVEILEAIIRQRYYILIVSPRSIASKWCQRELIRATELGKDIKPFILEPVSDEQLPLVLAGMHCVSISQGIEKAMPAILKELGVGNITQTQLQPDPFTQDGQLVHAIADALPHAAAFTDGLGLVLMLENIGLKCCNTDRARRIFAGMRGGTNWSVRDGMRSIDYDKVRSYLLREWAR